MISLPNQVNIAQDEREQLIPSDYSNNTPLQNHHSVQRSLAGPFDRSSFDENWSLVSPIRKGTILDFILRIPTIRYLRPLPLQLLITSFQTNYTVPVPNKPTISRLEIRGDSPANLNGYHNKVTYSSTISG